MRILCAKVRRHRGIIDEYLSLDECRFRVTIYVCFLVKLRNVRVESRSQDSIPLILVQPIVGTIIGTGKRSKAPSVSHERPKWRHSIARSARACKGKPAGCGRGQSRSNGRCNRATVKSPHFSLCGDNGVMTSQDLTSSTGLAAPARYLPVLLVLFVGSGCAALIYEVVWLQLLQLVIGSTAVSLGVLLGTFMGGMCAGSLLLPRLVSARRHPLRVYALLELGIGAVGLMVLLRCRTSKRFTRVSPAMAYRASCCAGPWPGCACCPPRC